MLGVDVIMQSSYSRSVQMDKSNGQAGRPVRVAAARPGEQLMTAAAELIAELGWGG